MQKEFKTYEEELITTGISYQRADGIWVHPQQTERYTENAIRAEHNMGKRVEY